MTSLQCAQKAPYVRIYPPLPATHRYAALGEIYIIDWTLMAIKKDILVLCFGSRPATALRRLKRTPKSLGYLKSILFMYVAPNSKDLRLGCFLPATLRPMAHGHLGGRTAVTIGDV